MKKVCKQCGTEFELERQHGFEQVFCSQTCKGKWQHEHNTEERTCVICGKPFTIYKYANTHTCSFDCAAQLREKFSLQKMTCEYCGREYEGHYKNRNRFCCRTCKELWQIQQRHNNPELTAAQNAQAREQRRNEPQKCPQCGEVFIPKKKGTVYCSRRCRNKATWAAQKKSCDPVQCAECGKEFIPERRNTKFCSMQCQKKNGHRREYEKRKAIETNSVEKCTSDN